MKIPTNMKVQIYLVVAVAMSSSCFAHPTDTQLQQINSDISSRNPRYIFPQFITIRNIECQRTESDGSTTIGECLTKTDCTNRKGEGWKPCLLGIGVCCDIPDDDSGEDDDEDTEVTCDDTMTTARANFTNPGHPAKYKEAGSCKLNIELVNDTICQVHLKFKTFTLDQPDASGICQTDYFKVTGTVNDLMYPKLCGENSDQHIYVDVDPTSNKPKLTVFTGSDTFDRNWDVEIEQIPCDSADRAPQGCLQYYKEPIGEITSFNFKPITSYTSANQHLANLDYGICFASGEYCSIKYEKNPADDKYGFIMTLNPISLGLDLLTLADSEDEAKLGDECNIDYIVIPQGQSNHKGSPTLADRYCGAGFPKKVSTTPSPFMMYVHTDSVETGDAYNNGFRLKYTMSTDCTVTV